MFQKSKYSLILIAIITSSQIYSQKSNQLSVGLNVTHFKDWKHTPLVFFGPEICYLKALSEKEFLYLSLSNTYGQATAKDLGHPGDISYRLLFGTDIGYTRAIGNDFGLTIGPSFRYRNEKKILYYYPQSQPFEVVIDPKRAHFDFGAFANAHYGIKLNRRSSIVIKVTYKIFNKGINPVSFGLFYNRQL